MRCAPTCTRRRSACSTRSTGWARTPRTATGSRSSRSRSPKPSRLATPASSSSSNGIYVTLAAYPLVPRSEVGFRIQVTAANTRREIDQLIDVLGDLANASHLQPGSDSGMTSTSRLRPGAQHAWACYLAAMAVLIGAYLFVPPFKGYAVVVNVIGVASLFAIAAAMGCTARARLAWMLLLVGQALYVAGDFYTYTYPDLLGGLVGFPSPGDAIYLCVYPALFAGLMLLVRRRDPDRRDRAAVLDTLVLTLGFALLFWVFLIAPNVHLSGLTALAKSVSTAYPIGDVLLLGAVIRFAVQAGRKTPAFYILFASTAALLATDCAYNYALLHNTYHHQVIFDLGWLSYIALWGAAALHPSMRELEQPAEHVRVRLTTTRLSLLAVACLIAPGDPLRRIVRQRGPARRRRRLRDPVPARRASRSGARATGGAGDREGDHAARGGARPRRRRRPRERQRRSGCCRRTDHRRRGEGSARALGRRHRRRRRVERRRRVAAPLRGSRVAALAGRACGRSQRRRSPSRPRSVSATAARRSWCASRCRTRNKVQS